MVVGFFLYATVAHLMPDALRGKPQNPEALLVYLAFDPSALYGTPLVVGSTIVIMFIWLGDLLIRSGGGEFFKDIAVAMMGRKARRPGQNLRRRLGAVRHDLRQRSEQRRLGWRVHHPDDEAHRLLRA